MQLAQRYLLPGADPSPVEPDPIDSPATLVLAFGPTLLLDDGEALARLAATYPRSVILGCSSAGEIVGDTIRDGGVGVVAARFARTALQRASIAVESVDDSFAAGARLGALLPRAGLRAVFMLSTGVRINGAALVAGLGSALPVGVPVSGGLAGDGSRFERTWVFDDGAAREHRVTAVGFYGESLRVGHGCRGGWSEFGPERRVTRSEGNVLFGLDDKPALTLYKHYLGEVATQLPGSALLFPLAVRPASQGTAAVVRTVLAVDEADQSMTFAGDIPAGASVRLMHTSVDRLVASAEQAAADALRSMAGPEAGPRDGAVLALSVSCIGRRLVMGQRTEEEVAAVAEQLPAGSVQAGFYSYGEVCALPGNASAGLHNQTLTLTVLAED